MYIQGLKNPRGRLLYKTKKKTAFHGFSMAIKAISGIFDEYVQSGQLKYLLTYKMSQDHLELFFCSMRSGLGQNNNPTCCDIPPLSQRCLFTKKQP